MAKKPQNKKQKQNPKQNKTPTCFYIKCTEELKAIQVFNVIKFFCLFYFCFQAHIVFFCLQS